MFGSLMMFASGLCVSAPSWARWSGSRCAGVRRSGKAARIRPASEMSRVSTDTPVPFVKARTIGQERVAWRARAPRRSASRRSWRGSAGSMSWRSWPLLGARDPVRGARDGRWSGECRAPAAEGPDRGHALSGTAARRGAGGGGRGPPPRGRVLAGTRGPLGPPAAFGPVRRPVHVPDPRRSRRRRGHRRRRGATPRARRVGGEARADGAAARSRGVATLPPRATAPRRPSAARERGPGRVPAGARGPVESTANRGSTVVVCPILPA